MSGHIKFSLNIFLGHMEMSKIDLTWDPYSDMFKPIEALWISPKLGEFWTFKCELNEVFNWIWHVGIAQYCSVLVVKDKILYTR